MHPGDNWMLHEPLQKAGLTYRLTASGRGMAVE